MKKKKLTTYTILAIIALWVVTTNIVMTFKHPEMTQTQLFLHLPQTIILNFK